MSLFGPDRSAERTPLSLVTGYLGSGKTTLLNRLLQHPGMSGSLVLVNEFGEIALDHHFIAAKEGDILLMRSGCLCCQVRGELETTLVEMAAKRARGEVVFSRVLVETTGLADPAPLVSLLLGGPFVMHDYRLDAVVATVDALHGRRQLEEAPEPVKQAAVADRIVVTKTDLAESAAVDALEARLASLNPAAPRFRAVAGDIPPDRLFDAGPYDPAGRGAAARRWLAAEAYGEGKPHHHHEDGHHHEPRHEPSVTSFCLTFDEPLPWRLFNAWLRAVREAWGDQLLRVKGLLNVAGEERPLVVHGVHRIFHPPTLLPAWPDADRRSRLVFITRGLHRADVEASWHQMQAEAAQA